MTSEQFVYWLQGYVELTGDAPPSAAQWKSMREHLATVFDKVTPPLTIEPPALTPIDWVWSNPDQERQAEQPVTKRRPRDRTARCAVTTRLC